MNKKQLNNIHIYEMKLKKERKNDGVSMNADYEGMIHVLLFKKKSVLVVVAIIL